MIDVLAAWGQQLPQMLDGLRISLFIAAVSICLGYPLGLLLAFMVTARNRLAKGFALVVVEIGRGAPALVILYLVYYGLPHVNISFDPVPSACIALTFNAAAYSSEMIRAGLQSVPRGQIEAAHALGLPRGNIWRNIVVPQGLRSSLPGLMGLAIQMFQGTSLAYGIAVPELMKQAYTIGSQNFQYLQVFLLAGVIYAVISIPATWITVVFERRLDRAHA